MESNRVQIPVNDITLEGNLDLPDGATGIIVFAHGSGSGMQSPGNRFTAKVFNAGGMGTLLLDLLSSKEELMEVTLISRHLVGVIDWLKSKNETMHHNIGLIGTSRGAASAFIAASMRQKQIKSIVSRGGRSDLAGNSLKAVAAPTLLIVGENDSDVLDLNRNAKASMNADVVLKTIPGATHHFEEPGTLEYAAELSRDWFLRYL